MEIDRGTSKTIFNEDMYNHLQNELSPLQKMSVVLSNYTREKIPLAGTVLVPVKYGSQECKLSAVVVQGVKDHIYLDKTGSK